MSDGHSTTTLAVFDGGPGNGHEHITGADTAEVSVIGDDHTLNLYARVPDERTLPDGRRAVVFRWRGPY